MRTINGDFALVECNKFNLKENELENISESSTLTIDAVSDTWMPLPELQKGEGNENSQV